MGITSAPVTWIKAITSKTPNVKFRGFLLFQTPAMSELTQRKRWVDAAFRQGLEISPAERHHHPQHREEKLLEHGGSGGPQGTRQQSSSRSARAWYKPPTSSLTAMWLPFHEAGEQLSPSPHESCWLPQPQGRVREESQKHRLPQGCPPSAAQRLPQACSQLRIR